MEEDYGKINLEDKYKGALRKAKEVREDVHKRNNGCEPSIAECLAYDMQYVEQYVEHLITRNKELEIENKDFKTGNNFSKAQIEMVEEAIRLGATDAIKKEMKNFLPKQKVKELFDELISYNLKGNLEDSKNILKIIQKYKKILGEED